MAVAAQLAKPQILTYEDYLREEEINRRYDIIDGVRIYMTQPTIEHQEFAGNIFELLRTYQRTSGRGRTIISPCDILISRTPLQTRQPDVLFISRERFGDRALDALPLSPAPELVVEVLSPSETRRLRQDKIKDYCSVDVKECWVVSPDEETVEILRLAPSGPERAALHGAGQTLQSLTFSDLTVEIDDIFRIEE